MNRSVLPIARRIGVRLKARGWQIGLIGTFSGSAVADRLTDVPGSSAYFAGSIGAPRPDTLAAWLPAAGVGGLAVALASSASSPGAWPGSTPAATGDSAAALAVAADEKVRGALPVDLAVAEWTPGEPPVDLAVAAAEWVRGALHVDLGVAVVEAGTDPGAGVAIALTGPDLSVLRVYRPRSDGADRQAAIGRAVLGTIDRALADPEPAA